jgi:ferredoxin-type protein NapG
MADLTRRGLLLGWLRGLPGATESEAPRARWVLRPPGAQPEHRLRALCDGCGECVIACPHDAVLLLDETTNAPNTPVIVPQHRPCRLCVEMWCALTCPTEALVVTAPAAVRMGVARVDDDRCWSAMGQPCDYCITTCPLDPPGLAAVNGRITVDSGRCTGCGLCEYYCTATPRAIVIVAPA